MRIPRGFGFVVPQVFGGESGASHQLLACTFVHQKFPGRVPEGAVLLRAFFGGDAAMCCRAKRTITSSSARGCN